MAVTILFVYNRPFNPMTGGVESVTDCLARELQNRGYCVKYLNLVEPSDDYSYPVPVYHFPSTDCWSEINYDFYKKFLEEENIDIVINQDACWSVSKLFLTKPPHNRKIKYISVLHNTPILDYKYFLKDHLSLKKITIREICKFLYRCVAVWERRRLKLKERRSVFNYVCINSDIVCLLSDKFKSDIVRYLTNTIPSNLISIPNPVRLKIDRDIDLSQKENIILFVGRLDTSKRIDRIIRVWNKIYKKYPDWSLYIIGDGPCKGDLERMAPKNGNVIFTGFQDPTPYYMRAKIICLTSNYEGWPMVLLEAMRYGVVPIVFSSFVSVVDIINSGHNGVLVPPFSLKQYKNGLMSMMDNSGALEMMAENAQREVQRFSIEKVVDQWENLFRRLLNN